jgi:hypothetical protein
MDIYEFLSRPLTDAIPDFTGMPETSPDGVELCRADLSVLRFAVRTKVAERIELSRDSQRAADRLSAHGLLEFWGLSSGLWFPTAAGRETVRVNSSCRDGSEPQLRPPAHFRETATADDQVVYPATADTDDLTDGDLLFYSLLETACSADKEPTPPAKPAARFWSAWLITVEFRRDLACGPMIWIGLAVGLIWAAAIDFRAADEGEGWR